ncbi:MAG: hypothetical protein JWP47_2158 [Polaromonas sp.]|nr:hypothetical protein [Polaromonas sp.]
MSKLKLPPVLAPVQTRWQAIAPREQALITAAAWLIGLALIWWLLMAPPLRMLGQADAQRRSLDAQVQKMQALQAQAQTLQSQPKLSREEAVRALESSVRQRLGTAAQLSVTGDRATLAFRSVPADALAQWLTQARVNARAIPSEARLSRASPGAAASAAPAAAGAPRGFTGAGAPGTPAPQAAGATVAWDGTMVMSLPAQ